MVTHAYNLSVWEAKAGGLLGVQGSLGLDNASKANLSETLSQKKGKKGDGFLKQDYD